MVFRTMNNEDVLVLVFHNEFTVQLSLNSEQANLKLNVCMNGQYFITLHAKLDLLNAAYLSYMQFSILSALNMFAKIDGCLHNVETQFCNLFMTST